MAEDNNAEGSMAEEIAGEMSDRGRGGEEGWPFDGDDEHDDDTDDADAADGDGDGEDAGQSWLDGAEP